MSFLFKNKKNKQFNYKTVYYDPLKKDVDKQSGKTSFSKEMYAKWDRIPFSELNNQGKKNAIRFLTLAISAILVAIYIYEEFEAYLIGLE